MAPIRIALDAMGGDNAPAVVIGGAALARDRYPEIQFLFYGDEEKLAPLMARKSALQGCSTIIHTAVAIANDEKPSVALRSGRQSSMRLAIDAVSAGEADGIVSAGNTGALMAMAKMVLKTLPGIDRPAIASFFPTPRGESVLLDLGANLDCSAANLSQFGLMGAVFAQTVLGIKAPSVGILNVGSEELKGSSAVRDAFAILRDAKLPGSFYGFVEGNDIPNGTTDVIVTDGFSGNAVLKTAEGMSKLYGEFLKQTFKSSLFAQLGYLLARNAFQKLRHRMDPRRYNGAVFLGLGSVCVKSHGGTDAVGFANAIGVAIDMISQGANAKIASGVESFSQTVPAKPDMATL
jgi:glycerol-3-phosphate acyltransferase PlsX